MPTTWDELVTHLVWWVIHVPHLSIPGTCIWFFFLRPSVKTMVETRSDRCFYVYHRTRASRAKACEKSYDKWKRYRIPSEVLIVPNPKKKQDKSSVNAPRTPSPTELSLPTNSPPMTDTTIPLSSALRIEMEKQIRVQRAQAGAFDRLLLEHSSTPSSDSS